MRLPSLSLRRLRYDRLAVIVVNFALWGLVLASGVALAGCETIQPGARTLRAAYCNGVSAGGRAAIATLATGSAETVIRCDNVAGAPAPTSPAQIVVVLKPGDLVAGQAVQVQAEPAAPPELRGPVEPPAADPTPY